jgi:hypothetical protein
MMLSTLVSVEVQLLTIRFKVDWPSPQMISGDEDAKSQLGSAESPQFRWCGFPSPHL